MTIIWILLGAAAVVLLAAYGCYRFAFYVPARKPLAEDAIDLPKGPAYEPYQERMEFWIREARKLPHRDVEITSFDGLTTLPFISILPPSQASAATERRLITLDTFKNLSKRI